MKFRKARLAAAIGGAAALLALAGAPLGAGAADHLDAPGLTPPSARADADITDIYAFKANNPEKTVLVLNTGPATGAIAPLDYGRDVRYVLNVARNTSTKPRTAFVVRFGKGNGTGAGQPFTVTRFRGRNASTLEHGTVVARGVTGRSARVAGDGRVFAGLRSDPFFFDLEAFEGAVLGLPVGRTFCDARTTDFFADFNVNSIVLEVPTESLVEAGDSIGYWATTSSRALGQIDRMGRPAINTVFNKGADKNAFNHGSPADDFTGFSGNVITTLMTLGGYTTAQATSLAHVLLPDILTYNPAKPVAGPLNGRALTDDVIDAELNLVTNGKVPSDCVGPHRDLLAVFPYVGAPHKG